VVLSATLTQMRSPKIGIDVVKSPYSFSLFSPFFRGSMLVWLKPNGKRETVHDRPPTTNGIIESLIQEGSLEHVKKDGKRLFKFKNRRRLYSMEELYKMLGALA